MEAIAIAALIRVLMYGSLFIVAGYKRYPMFFVIGLLGMISNVAVGLSALAKDPATAQVWLEISGCAGVVLIALIVLKAFEGMKLRDAIRRPLTKQDLHLK